MKIGQVNIKVDVLSFAFHFLDFIPLFVLLSSHFVPNFVTTGSREVFYGFRLRGEFPKL